MYISPYSRRRPSTMLYYILYRNSILKCPGIFPKHNKVKVGEIFNNKKTCLKCFLVTESVSTTCPDFLIIWNNGTFLLAGKCWNMLSRALTGHNGEFPKSGIVIVAICFLSC